MAAWSRFMIDLSEHWLVRTNRGDSVPEIGQMRFILAQAAASNALANTAAQTLFLLPNGDWALPDYRNGWTEYMNRFGNGLGQGFEDVLRGPKRKAYLRRQALRNGNAECSACAHGAHCVMEFWKPNRADDDCFGGKTSGAAWRRGLKGRPTPKKRAVCAWKRRCTDHKGCFRKAPSKPIYATRRFHQAGRP